MAFTSGAAQAYLGNFSPFLGVPGFAGVKSDTFTDTLGAVQQANVAAELALAKTAIPEAYATDRLEKQLAYNKYVTDQEIKQNKRNAIRLAGAALSGFLPATGLPARQTLDPRVLQQQQAGFDAAMRQYRRAGQTATGGAVLSAIQQLSGAA